MEPSLLNALQGMGWLHLCIACQTLKSCKHMTITTNTSKDWTYTRQHSTLTIFIHYQPNNTGLKIPKRNINIQIGILKGIHPSIFWQVITEKLETNCPIAPPWKIKWMAWNENNSNILVTRCLAIHTDRFYYEIGAKKILLYTEINNNTSMFYKFQISVSEWKDK